MFMDEAEKWLKENDPLFNQRTKIEYKYHSENAINHILRKEISYSDVSVLGVVDSIMYK